MAEEALPRLDPVEAIAFFRSKGWEIGFDWRDVWEEEHARAFTVAKAMTRDLLEDIRAAVDSAIAEGKTLRQFAGELRPRLVAKGWWGRKLQKDPQTGVEKVVQLGSPARLRTIYETNLRTSYIAGRWQRIERAKRTLPLLRYVSVMDGRERPEHHAWHGTILPVDDPWWDTHFPPCGWGCRCDGQALNQRMLERKGWQLTEPQKFPERDYVNKRTGEITKVERGIDPGWSYNVGKASLDALAPSPRIGSAKGEEEALQASLSESDYRTVSGFFAAFGIRDRAAAVKGVVWEDAAGWPMAISLGLLRRPDGTMARLGARAAMGLAAAARVLTRPETIGLVWVTALDGRALLVRRYRSPEGVVDIAGSFWRWFVGSPRRFDAGKVVWSADRSELAARDRYVRDRRGRFASKGAGALSFIDGAIANGDGRARFDLDALSGHAVAELSRLGLSGVDRKGKTKVVSLDRSVTRHIFQRHGKDGRGQIAIGADDLLNMPDLLSSGRFNHGTPPISASGSPLVHVRGSAGGRSYSATFEVRKHTVVPKSVRRKK